MADPKYKDFSAKKIRLIVLNQYEYPADTNDGAKYYMSKEQNTLGNRPSRVEPKVHNNIIPSTSLSLNPSVSNMQQNNIHPQKVYNGAQNNQQNPILETEEEWLKRLRRQRQRKGFFS